MGLSSAFLTLVLLWQKPKNQKHTQYFVFAYFITLSKQGLQNNHKYFVCLHLHESKLIFIKILSKCVYWPGRCIQARSQQPHRGQEPKSVAHQQEAGLVAEVGLDPRHYYGMQNPKFQFNELSQNAHPPNGVSLVARLVRS